jgi:hypothetical protein
VFNVVGDFISKILLRYHLIVGSLRVLLKKEISIYSVSVNKYSRILYKSSKANGRDEKLSDVMSVRGFGFPHPDSASDVVEPWAVGTVYGVPHSILCAVARVASHIITVGIGLRYAISRHTGLDPVSQPARATSVSVAKGNSPSIVAALYNSLTFFIHLLIVRLTFVGLWSASVRLLGSLTSLVPCILHNIKIRLTKSRAKRKELLIDNLVLTHSFLAYTFRIFSVISSFKTIINTGVKDAMYGIRRCDSAVYQLFTRLVFVSGAGIVSGMSLLSQTTQSSWRTRSAIPDAPARERLPLCRGMLFACSRVLFACRKIIKASAKKIKPFAFIVWAAAFVLGAAVFTLKAYVPVLWAVAFTFGAYVFALWAVAFNSGAVASALGASAFISGSFALVLGAFALALWTSASGSGASAFALWTSAFISGASTLVSGAIALASGASALVLGAYALASGADALMNFPQANVKFFNTSDVYG